MIAAGRDVVLHLLEVGTDTEGRVPAPVIDDDLDVGVVGDPLVERTSSLCMRAVDAR